ncbi:MAG TPA: hypothetical protein IAA52_10925 [Candidatus Pullichristensenella stercorigallinarum]|uniref:Uncharacterized protein n=1 Tax=Candidatus Pullichristensenella stercorigallinarum TaxID=2840909 RepID=A0A9D1CXR9_9FIRM|nr:hypothetical protein [Candidatus Pullichristensenella stercorigallinarum]
MRKKRGWGDKKILDVTIKELCLYLGLALCCEIFGVIVANYYIDRYSGEHFFTVGILESVSFESRKSEYKIELRMGGKQYEISRPYNIPSYNYGIEGDSALDAMRELQAQLEGNIGREIRIEYIEHRNQILGLTIGDTEYINADAALKDFTAAERSVRNIFLAAFVITFVPFVMILFRLLHEKNFDESR